jgi:hypothetical protein
LNEVLLVTGRIGAKEIDRLIAKLQLENLSRRTARPAPKMIDVPL